MTTKDPINLKIATFNVENLDKPRDATVKPSIDDRIKVLRPQLHRLRADILLLQEVHAQKVGRTYKLEALADLIKGTRYEGYHMVHTTSKPNGKTPMTQRNLVILSRYPITDSKQIKHEYVPAPVYQMVTASPAATNPEAIQWERPILYAAVELPNGETVHLVNLHLKSKLPTPVPGGKVDRFTWANHAASGEGAFLSSMKRVGQAAETRVFIDTLFDADEDALILVAGDFNADFDEVPTKMIRGLVEEHGNPALVARDLVPCETSVSPDMRYSILHHGDKRMFDHLMVSRGFMHYYLRAEVHNETLKDESIAFATDDKYPGSDHAPVVAEFLVDDHC